MFYLGPAERRRAVILGSASGLKSLGAGVERRLLHFCTRLITLTFDHVLCSGSRSHGSCAASLRLPSPPPEPPTTTATTSIAIQKQICILRSCTTLTFGERRANYRMAFRRGRLINEHFFISNLLIWSPNWRRIPPPRAKWLAEWFP